MRAVIHNAASIVRLDTMPYGGIKKVDLAEKA
jgi:hypothetical protein